MGPMGVPLSPSPRPILPDSGRPRGAGHHRRPEWILRGHREAEDEAGPPAHLPHAPRPRAGPPAARRAGVGEGADQPREPGAGPPGRLQNAGGARHRAADGLPEGGRVPAPQAHGMRGEGGGGQAAGGQDRAAQGEGRLHSASPLPRPWTTISKVKATVTSRPTIPLPHLPRRCCCATSLSRTRAAGTCCSWGRRNWRGSTCEEGGRAVHTLYLCGRGATTAASPLRITAQGPCATQLFRPLLSTTSPPSPGQCCSSALWSRVSTGPRAAMTPSSTWPAS